MINIPYTTYVVSSDSKVKCIHFICIMKALEDYKLKFKLSLFKNRFIVRNLETKQNNNLSNKVRISQKERLVRLSSN